MRVLLLHPEDSPLAGAWGKSRWDLVVDLGWAGRHRYGAWSGALASRVRSVIEFGDWKAANIAIRESLQAGKGSLVDVEGVDWWELFAASHFQRLLEFVQLQALGQEIQGSSEIRATRPHTLVHNLSALIGTPITFFEESLGSGSPAFSRYMKIPRTLSLSQIFGIALDKWDTDYGLRRFFSRREKKSESAPCVLLPSSYRNVTRAQMAYANLLPEREFLLVTTRKDGDLKNLPPHVNSASLAAYAPVPRKPATEREIESLTKRWHGLREKLRGSDEPILAHAARLFDNFALRLRNGLRIRDAWRGVFERETIDAVLCGDENNIYTRLPVLLAKRRGIRTVYCSHGALDSNILIRGVCSDIYLTKGEMEADYLARECGVPEERITIGAASSPSNRSPWVADRPDIVFFSEPYELYSGRTDVLYGDILPALCKVARDCGKKVILKLHPFESLAARSQLVDRLLNAEDRKLVEVTAEPMSEKLLDRIWASLTVESSVAVECSLAGIPSFLCGWFDIDLYGYGRQFERYGAAIALRSPEDVLHLPELLASFKPETKVQERLLHPIDGRDFQRILSGPMISQKTGT
jgi:hypothetical protein